MSSLVHGVGINDANYAVTPMVNGVVVNRCPFYEIWKGLLLRCYSESYLLRYPSYVGTTVDKDWHLFSNFKEWMSAQDWKGKQLDKDILVPGNKVYSATTCIFVSRQINMLLSNAKGKSDLPVGVTLRPSGRYTAAYSHEDKKITIGTYDTKTDAAIAYLTAKASLIERIAKEQNEQLSGALKLHAKRYNEEALALSLESN